uniref:Retrotransposon gag domain-containing protein n=1 Tax=Fagus sylvatica TaxID=28930 RepID=A0A2N9JAT3_FAGSY
MPPKSKRIGTINSKMPLQDGAIASNSSPQEVHQEVEHGAIGSALEHVSKFLDAMGPHVGDSNLCLREFSKSLTDRAYTWYMTLQPTSMKTWDDMVKIFCGKFFRVEERVTLHTLHSVKQKAGEGLLDFIKQFQDLALDYYARKTAASVKPVERSRADKRSTLHALVVTSSNDTRNKKKRGKEKEFEEWPAIPCTTEEMHAVIDKWIADGFLRLPNVSKEPTEDDKKHARKAAIEAIVNIAAGSGSQCYTAEAHASQAFLETTNAVTFTDEDMEVQYPDHRKPLKKIQGIPMEVIGFGGAAEYTVGHIQLVLKVGSIVALTRFYVVNIAVSYHALLGRPWLHKHKLVLSIYHQCVKGCLNGKPISILANATLFDESEAHYVETAFYDEVTPTEEGLISKVVGTPLPRWEDIKDEPDMDLRKLLG